MAARTLSASAAHIILCVFVVAADLTTPLATVAADVTTPPAMPAATVTATAPSCRGLRGRRALGSAAEPGDMSTARALPRLHIYPLGVGLGFCGSVVSVFFGFFRFVYFFVFI
jgi:hypothetical protein